MLNNVHLQNATAVRKFLLEKTQHIIGGFAKLVGDSPGITLCIEISHRFLICLKDILHSYLGLAALSILDDPYLRPIDPTLCISIRAKENFEENSRAQLNQK